MCNRCLMRKPLSAVKNGETVTFDSGYHMTGVVVQELGTYNGMMMIKFLAEGADRIRIFSYAAHRSVIVHA